MSTGLPKIGELVAGRYRILQELGRGGYGVVYRARQDVMGRDVALKVLNPEAAKKEAEVERFRREVFHASGLRHPNTIQLFDFGETNGLFYIVMEFLEGANLRDWVMMRGALNHDQAVEVTTQILKSLREAHSHGIVHRDLKPENIFLVDMGSPDEIFVKVLDFGLSKYVEGNPMKEPTLTKEGVIFGTPQYMSPEQAYGQKVRPETDMYALGLLIYEMVTARCAFTGRSSMEILIKQVSQPLPNFPDKLRGTLLDDFVAVCTKKEMKDRFANAEEAHQWLVRKKNEISMVSIMRPPALEEMPPPGEDPVMEIPPPPPISTSGIEESIDTSGIFVQGAIDVEMRLAQMPLVGRQHELDELMNWSRQALFSGGVSWVTGELGIGKTRLVDEWLRHFEMEGVVVLRGTYHEDGAPLEGLREAMGPIIQRETGEHETLPQALTLDRLVELRSILMPEEGGGLEYNVTTASGQDWAFARIEQSLFTVASAKPTVILLENVQWADSFTARLIDHWQEEMATRSAPLLLVLTSRTDEMGASQKLTALSRMGRRYAAVSFAHSIQLARLAPDDADRVLRHIIALNDDVREFVGGLARGNPLFLTQIVRYLVEEELLEYDESSRDWGFRAGVADRDRLVPPNLSDLLIRRVKSLINKHTLGVVLKALLTRAMLIGGRFEMRLLKEMLHREGRNDLEAYFDDALERLARSGLLRPTVIGNQPGLEFGYNVTRKALLDSEVSAGENLPEMHRIIAEVKSDFYENASSDRRGELAHSIAGHFEAAGNSREAFNWITRAADHIERSQDFRGALECFREAERLLDTKIDPDGERLLDIRLAQGRLHRFLGEYGPAEYALRAAHAEASKVGDLVGVAMSGESLGEVLMLLARYDEAEEALLETLEKYEGFPDEAGAIRCQIGLGEIVRFKGHYIDAAVTFESGLNRAEAINDEESAIRALYGLGQCAYAAGNLHGALDIFQQTRKRAEVVDNWRVVSSCDIEIAMAQILVQGTRVAEELLMMALDTKRNLGDTLGQAHAHIILAITLRRSTRLEDADYHAQRALALSERLSHKYGTAKAILAQGEIAWVRGNLDLARKRAADARKLHEDIEDSHGLALAYIYSGLFECDAMNFAQAQEFIERALEIGGKQGLGLYQTHCLLFYGMTFEGLDNLEEAVAYYGEALQIAEASGNREFASLAAISLAKLHLVMGDIEAVKAEIPIARTQAERLGNNIAMLFALTGEAWLANMTQNPHVLQASLQKLRVLADRRTGANLRVPERLVILARQSLAHQPEAKGRRAVNALIEVIEALGADDIAQMARIELLGQSTGTRAL